MEIVRHIDQTSRAIDDLFAAILDISKLDAGTVDVNRVAFDLAPILERLAREAEDAVAEKGVVLRIRLPNSRVTVRSDPILVERIVRNLLSNAVRYTQEGGVLIACRSKEKSVSIEIWDTGPGIPEEEREAIFQEYYQIGNKERDRNKGLGLGLAIVRRLVSLLGCELVLRSRVGRGSVFAVQIPATEPLDASSVTALVKEAETSRPGAKIVLIDDEAEIRIGMSQLLRRWGYQVFTARSAIEAESVLREQSVSPDLIIADFRLRDDETGIAAIECLRLQFNREIAAILLTGDTAPERLIEAHRSGLALLHKPVSNGRLRAAVRNSVAAQGALSGPIDDGPRGI